MSVGTDKVKRRFDSHKYLKKKRKKEKQEKERNKKMKKGKTNGVIKNHACNLDT